MSNAGYPTSRCFCEKWGDFCGRNKKLSAYLLLIRALAPQLARNQKTPDHLVRIEIGACLPDGFFGLILLPAGPRISRALHAVEHDLRILLAAVVGLHLGFHAALAMRRKFAVLRFLRAAIDLRPRFRAIFHRKRLQVEIVLRASAIRNDRI